MSAEEFSEIMSSSGGQDSRPANRGTSFSGEVGALFREGLKDLQNAILPAFPESQRGVEEPGTPLNPTQQMVTEDLNPPNRGGYEPPMETSLKEILSAPTPPMTPTVERDNGREM